MPEPDAQIPDFKVEDIIPGVIVIFESQNLHDKQKQRK